MFMGEAWGFIGGFWFGLGFFVLVWFDLVWFSPVSEFYHSTIGFSVVFQMNLFILFNVVSCCGIDIFQTRLSSASTIMTQMLTVYSDWNLLSLTSLYLGQSCLEAIEFTTLSEMMSVLKKACNRCSFCALFCVSVA